MIDFFNPRIGLAISLMRLVFCLALVTAVSALGAVTTYPEIPTWYAGLAKPAWAPPNSAFPIVWTLLYLFMALSLWRLWDRAPRSPARARGIGLFMVQLAFNAAWSPVFFGLHAPWAGLVIILALIAALAATMREAFRADDVAGWLLLPYLPWVCYAAALNGAIAFLN